MVFCIMDTLYVSFTRRHSNAYENNNRHMMFLKDTEAAKSNAAGIGGKAAGLCSVMKLGYDVPRWIVIPAATFNQWMPSAEQASFIDQFSIPGNIINDITAYLGNVPFYAVRSSATGEDGDKHSFAGQFGSILFVTRE